MESIKLPQTTYSTKLIGDIKHYPANIHELASITLTERQCYDLELLLNGGFAPLNGFLNRNDYETVLEHLRLSDGTVWPIPINLDVKREVANERYLGEEITLRDSEGLLLGILTITDVWPVDKMREARALFGTDDQSHPGVFYLFNHVQEFYLGGRVTGIALPYYYDFQHLRYTPCQLGQLFRELGWEKIVAFQTRNPMHRAHQELTERAMQAINANLLIHPVVGMTKPGDIDYFTRVRCYEHVLKTYPPRSAVLSLLPLAMRMAGPKEALWHAIIRKNYHCTHFIVGRDHAGPGKNKAGQFFYDPYAAQHLTEAYQDEIGIKIVPFQEMLYSQKYTRYYTRDEFPKDDTPLTLSGTELRAALQKSSAIPEWFSYPSVIHELRKMVPLKNKQGLTIFFTGLPSSGKSTLANHLVIKLRELTDRRITLLDGDIIRTHLSKGLGFSKEDRETNITRVGFVASEITKHGGIAICALVAPFKQARQSVKEMITPFGGFIEVHVSTPLAVCEARDRKGYFKKARAGYMPHFTGVSDPYEAPITPDLHIDTTHLIPQDGIAILINQLQLLGYL